MASAPCRRPVVSPPSLRLELRQLRRAPARFDSAFIDRRMREHRELQKRIQQDLAADIIEEVRGLEAANGLRH